jgi:hypothetical protein
MKKMFSMIREIFPAMFLWCGPVQLAAYIKAINNEKLYPGNIVVEGKN